MILIIAMAFDRMMMMMMMARGFDLYVDGSVGHDDCGGS